MIRLDNIGKQNGHQIVFIEAAATLNRGEKVGLVGPNGAGKTTLFNVVSGIARPTSGTVHLDGRDVTGMSVHRRARAGLGRTFQTSSLFPQLTVRENVRMAAQVALGGSLSPVRFPRLGDRATRAAEVHLAEVGLADKLDLPAGSLSHGDKRKLELAILLAQDLSVWLLDEPAAGLATEQVPEFMALVDRARKDGAKTVVLVEHNMNVVMSLSDRITVMHGGELLAEGTPAEIAANEAVRKAYLGELYDLSEFGLQGTVAVEPATEGQNG